MASARFCRVAMKSAAVTACALFLSSCDRSDFTLVNGTKDRVVDLWVSDSRTTWKLGDLQPGERLTFAKSLAGEGSPTISWTWQGKLHSDQGCYYTGGFPARGSITVVGDHLAGRCE
jgi:hypothetical protein